MLIRVPPEGASGAPGAGMVDDRVMGLHFTPGDAADLAGSKTIRARRTSRCGVGGAEPSLQHRAILRLQPDFHSIGYHPYVES